MNRKVQKWWYFPDNRLNIFRNRYTRFWRIAVDDKEKGEVEKEGWPMFPFNDPGTPILPETKRVSTVWNQSIFPFRGS